MKKRYQYRKYELTPKTGNKIVDNHHINYIKQINDLVDILNDEKDKESIYEIFHNILYYAEKYFIEEEFSYQKTNYSNLKEHREQHREFIKKISFFRKAYQNKVDNICEEMMKFLDRWYKEHIIKEDSDATMIVN